EDDWSGITDLKERRKRQNRLHQRIWRTSVTYDRTLQTGQGTCSRPTAENINTRTFSLPEPSHLAVDQAAPRPPTREWPEQLSLWSVLSHAFPLSADHKLITLVQDNVLRGILTSILILSLQDLISTDCGYNLKVPPLLYAPLSRPPANFEPTQIQQTIKHGLWIDTIPSPEFRDNLIMNQHLYDGDDLCDDLVGGLYEGFNDVEVRGIMLWSDPWFEDGWELSEGFVKKWGFLLKGCRRMAKSTNEWRERRGEGKLMFEV
ncbi:hypothetical protein EDB81DRAFT_636258, partial [Dactylonectria macrodidyma]